jgi:hypothetical protein
LIVYPQNEFRAQKFDIVYLKNGTSCDFDNLAPILLPRSKVYPRKLPLGLSDYPRNELKAPKCDLIYLKNGTSGDHDNLAPILLTRSKVYPQEKYI